MPQNELEPFFAVVEENNTAESVSLQSTQRQKCRADGGFSENEYGQTGKGFEINGNPVSVWFDEHGMSVGYGTQAKETPLVTMSWEEVENHIRSMIEKWHLYECE